MQVGKLKNRVIIRNIVLCLLCGAAGWYMKAKLTPQMPNMMAMGGGEPAVLVQKITASNISPQSGYIAHVEPIKSVDLRPQVAGYVEKVLFEEGSHVQEGDVLIIIEQDRYKATVALREAELDAAKANLVRMERDYKRQVSLSKQNIASKATFDNAESNYLQAEAAVKQAEANLDLAKIDLDYTEIKAPFSGYIGKALVREGNYVSSNSTSLARIVQVNPIRVAFSMTDKDYLNKFIVSLATQWAADEAIVISTADAEGLKKYFAANAKAVMDKGVKIEQVNGNKTLFSISPADGSYKVNFGEEEFENYFKEFLRPQLVEMLF